MLTGKADTDRRRHHGNAPGRAVEYTRHQGDAPGRTAVGTRLLYDAHGRAGSAYQCEAPGRAAGADMPFDLC